MLYRYKKMEHVQWDKTKIHDLEIDVLNVFREVVKFTDDTILLFDLSIIFL